ncbi:hypothetical protein [Actinomadura violacea]|uniref:Uncharacterized protein n=1 Tax=Actinomadura violacea TaxID=2819934 RepID=A0ABS3RWU7_9ACTN|nr:hypothetical protein [Actinomadura violacea]MBO2461162.1 hypothetical protein [Actinomadura violacea]
MGDAKCDAGKNWLDMGARDFDTEAGPEAEYRQEAMFPEPDPCGTADLLS